jgi:hypothetical protein
MAPAFDETKPVLTWGLQGPRTQATVMKVALASFNQTLSL